MTAFYDNNPRLDEAQITELGERAFAHLVVENMTWRDGLHWVWEVPETVFRPTGRPSHTVWGIELGEATQAA